MGKQRMLVGCPTCRLCTGSAFTGMGRSMGRGAANVATLGVAALARRTCKACEHPMAEHQTQQVQVVQPPPMTAQMAAPVPPPALPAGWYTDPTDGRAMCWWDGFGWRPETKHYPQR